jgi:hypothetical protein
MAGGKTQAAQEPTDKAASHLDAEFVILDVVEVPLCGSFLIPH